MYQYQWQSVTITTNKQANDCLAHLHSLKPTVGAFDTETNGLHIIRCTPFVYAFGYLDQKNQKGYTYAVDMERQPNLAKAVINAWQEYAKTLELYLGHNVKYDLHMMTNAGLPYTTENLSDTMFYIRYGHDNLTEKNGGPPLGLKPYTMRYISSSAGDPEKILKQERSAIAKDINMKLRIRLKGRMTLAQLEAFFKDPIHDYTDLPEDLQCIYLDWLSQDVPLIIQKYVHGIIESDQIPYTMLNRDNLLRYVHFDIIDTLEIWLQLDPIVKARKNTRGIEVENPLIIPLYEMERVGFKADKEYIESCRVNLKQYIKERRERLYILAGQELAIGQHALVKSILNNDYGMNLSTTNGEEMELTISELKRNDPENPAIEFMELIEELRTLEKWYSTYIIRFLNDLKDSDRLYTTINQVGTVSGRVTSDFQQFPKEPIVTKDGVELFYPRKMINVTGGNYDSIVYLDFSQIELRFQAMYTILVGDPDLNLCRAYMPYKCHDIFGCEFDPFNPLHILNWDDKWFLDESPDVPWKPTDVHGATTEKATGLTPDNPEFKKFRTTIGKRTNFAKNYGAQRKRIRQMFPEKSEEEITRIDNAYYEAFPGVKSYHNYCYQAVQQLDHVDNMFNIGYWGVSGHKLINLLIQGSSAYYLKIKERQIYDYLKQNNLKSRWQMQIHDELSWEHHKADDIQIFYEIKRIMEDWTDAIVPVVAEMDATTSTWAAKKGVHSPDELRLYSSN